MVLDDKIYVPKVTEMLQDTETYEVIKRDSTKGVVVQVCGECLWSGGMRIIYPIQNTGYCFAVISDQYIKPTMLINY